MSASWELQKAIFERLTSDTALTGLLGSGKVYDRVPRRPSYPYVTIGRIATRDWSTATETGSEHTIRIDAWSQAHGERETHLVLAAIVERLHDQPLTLPGHRLINIRHENHDAFKLTDGKTYQGAARFRAVTEPTSS